MKEEINKEIDKNNECCKEECNCKEKCNCKENPIEECNCTDDCCKGECNTNEDNSTVEKESNSKLHKNKKNKKEQELEKKLEETLKVVNDLNEKLLREKAEVINYRRRKDDEVSKLLKYSNEDLILEMLPIIDNFENAIKMDDDNLEDEVSKFLKGFKMIYGNLLTVLEKFEIKPIDGVNKPFDPTYHQAVMTEKSDKESGIVIDVLRKGYILKDKVIRPAMVKVSE